ncbi:hypothetical protein QTP70_026166 [Hemibagrus guttatus]|uniref:Uncharacterized protein n=1 Tax=Hemibagrus guttatus TaxID=175788 RepID=A0AAE0VAS7_9TELE|nr:hypothetical protein QTP70_026166 [Hemibagrus guttatus]
MVLLREQFFVPSSSPCTHKISDTTRNPATFRNSLMTVGCIQGGNTSEYQTAVDNFVTWCELNHLQLSVGKTKELVVDFRKSRTPVSPLSVHGEKVEIVEDYKYLGVHIDNKLDWTLNSTALYKKVTCPTMGERTLDHCYTTIKDGYKAQSCPPFGKSDHAAIFLMQKYKQRLKQEVPAQREVARWTDQLGTALQDTLQDALNDAEWDMFWHSSEDINVFTEAVVGFIGKLADDTVQKTIIRTFPNQKPWVDKTIRDALRSCTAAYNTGLASGDMDSYKAASNVWKVVKEAKQRYGRKLESQLQQSDSRSLWQGLRTITDYKAPTSGMSNAYACLADELNIFYARFEAAAIDVNAKANTNAIANAKANASGYRQEENANTENAFIISKHDVKSSVNTRIAAGLDRISGLVLRACADQLALVFTEIFNLSLIQ